MQTITCDHWDEDEGLDFEEDWVPNEGDEERGEDDLLWDPDDDEASQSASDEDGEDGNEAEGISP